MVSKRTVISSFFCAAILLQFSNGRSVDKESEMKSALKQGDVEKARDLIRDGALKDFLGPKTREIVYNKLRIVQLLLSSGITVINTQDNDLEKAPCEDGAFDVVLVPGSSLITRMVVNFTVVKNWGNKTIIDGRKPIHVISLLPDVTPSIVQIVLENGNDDVNTRTDMGMTPLMCAASSGNLEVVKFLVERGAKVNDIVFVPYDRADLDGHFLFAKLFSRTELNTTKSHIHYTPLLAGIIGFNVDVVKYMLSKGADVNNTGQGWLLLYPAVDRGQTEVVEILLQSGIDVNSKDMLGSTALHRAAESGHVELAKILLKNGARLNASDALGWMPLHVASFFSNKGGKEMIRLFVQSGSNIKSLTDGGYSPLNLVEAGFNPYFLSFLAKNIDCLNQTKNCTDIPEEDTNNMHADIVDSVIKLGASLNHQDGILGWSTLHWAAALGDLDVAKLLVKHGVSINVRSKTERNPLETAAHFGRTKVAEFLKTTKNKVK